MTIFLVRHAKAGNRSDWNGDDWLRPLTTSGQTQARGLLAQFHAERFTTILSSPYVRCMETVVPLASAHGLPIVPTEALAEDHTIDEVLAVLQAHVDGGLVVCSHGAGQLAQQHQTGQGRAGPPHSVARQILAARVSVGTDPWTRCQHIARTFLTENSDSFESRWSNVLSADAMRILSQTRTMGHQVQSRGDFDPESAASGSRSGR